MPASYVELEIAAGSMMFDELVGMLSQYGFEGFWEEETSLKCYIGSERWSPEQVSGLQVLADSIARAHGVSSPRFSSRIIQDQNWNAAWEATIKPIRVTDRIVIAPTWHPYEAKPGEITLFIDPKMSFGTGYHETTRLMLKLLEKNIHRDMTVLDVGTGTGVLAIAAVKLGALSAVGVDNDEWSYDNARENVRLNSVEKQVQIVQGELAAVRVHDFHIVAANIQRNVILQLMVEMKNRLRPRGLLLLSGLLRTDREAVLTTLESSGFELSEELTENEWLAIVAVSVA